MTSKYEPKEGVVYGFPTNLQDAVDYEEGLSFTLKKMDIIEKTTQMKFQAGYNVDLDWLTRLKWAKIHKVRELKALKSYIKSFKEVFE